MYYELYIDLFFFENFMMDSILLLFVRSVFGKKSFTIRTFTAGVIAAVFSCVVIVIRMPEAVKCFCNYCIIPIVMIWLGVKISNIVQLFEGVLLLYFTAICLGGIMQLFRPYMGIVSVMYVSALMGCFILKMSWNLLTREGNLQKRCCQVVLYDETKKWDIRAMIDTGNMLQDPAGQKPVHIISKKMAEKIYGTKMVEELLEYSLSKENEEKWMKKKLHYIPCQTIQGTHLLPVVTMEKMEIIQKSIIEIQMPQIGIGIMEETDYQMIVNAQSIGGTKYGCRDNKYTTV